MKLFLLLLATVFAAVHASPVKGSDEEGWYVPDGYGHYKWISKSQFDEDIHHYHHRAGAVTYYLYTKSNPTSPQVVTLDDANSLSKSNFNSANPTRFIIHGWQNNYQSDVNIEVRNALMKSGTYNVISVDWSSSAQTVNYAAARNAVPAIGKDVGSFIDFLNQKGGMAFSSLTVIGHSLGAHVSGFAGKSVTRGKVQVIIGLDPAFPLFTYIDCATRLCSTDANTVESIQTNGGTLGFLEPIGRAAFYPNGGKSQPGCGIDLTGSCAHSRSFMYYAEALVKNDFPSMSCPNFEAAVSKNCGSSYSNVKMGSAASYGTSGTYYVPVNSQSPYGMG